MTLCRHHYHDELQLQLCHESSVCMMLERLAASHRDHTMALLDNIHHRQVQQLKRQMDVANKDEMKMLAVKYTDKHELARYCLIFSLQNHTKHLESRTMTLTSGLEKDVATETRTSRPRCRPWLSRTRLTPYCQVWKLRPRSS